MNLSHSLFQFASNPKCVSWNYSAVNRLGNWTTSGCYVESMDSNFVVCKCIHLTNFGLLVVSRVSSQLI